MALGQKCAQKQRASPDQDSRNSLQSAPDPDLEQSQLAQNQALAKSEPNAHWLQTQPRVRALRVC